MVLFGIDEKEAKAFASKYVRLFNLASRHKDVDRNIESAYSGLDKKISMQSMHSEKPTITRSAINEVEF